MSNFNTRYYKEPNQPRTLQLMIGHFNYWNKPKKKIWRPKGKK